MSASVTWLIASWPSSYSDGSAAVSTDRLCGDLVERNCHVISNHLVALNCHVITNRHIIVNRHVIPNGPLRHPHLSVLFWGWRGVASESPDGRRTARTVIIGARSVTRPLTGDICAVRAHCRKLHRLNHCLPITARGRLTSDCSLV